MPDRERKTVPDHRFKVLKGSLLQRLPVHHRNMEDLSIRGCVRGRAEIEQLREV